MTAQQLSAEFKFKGRPLLLIAIGATLAFLPSIIGLMILIVGECFRHQDFLIPFIVQAVGAAIMIVGYSKVYTQIKQLKIKKSGFILGIIASSIGFVANLLFGIINAEDNLLLHIGKIYFGTLLLVLGFLSTGPLLAISSFKISKFFTKFRVFSICMTVVSSVILASYLLWFAFPHGTEKRQSFLENVNTKGFYKIERYNEYSGRYDEPYYRCYKSYHRYEDIRDDSRTSRYRIVKKSLSYLTFFALGISLIGAMTAAWILTKAKPLNAIVKRNESKMPLPEVVAAPAVDHSRYMPKEETAVSKPVLSDEVVNLLLGYDNERLKEIIENPLRYNPAVVEKAGMLLRLRLAWEQIKDVSDKELLAMAMAIRGLYDENIVEAASMELYQRDSQLLREQFMLMMPDDVSAIASGTAPAPEGIRLAAQKYLSRK